MTQPYTSDAMPGRREPSVFCLEYELWAEYERRKRSVRERLNRGEISTAEYEVAIKELAQQLGV